MDLHKASRMLRLLDSMTDAYGLDAAIEFAHMLAGLSAHQREYVMRYVAETAMTCPGDEALLFGAGALEAGRATTTEPMDPNDETVGRKYDVDSRLAALEDRVAEMELRLFNLDYRCAGDVEPAGCKDCGPECRCGDDCECDPEPECTACGEWLNGEEVCEECGEPASPKKVKVEVPGDAVGVARGKKETGDRVDADRDEQAIQTGKDKPHPLLDDCRWSYRSPWWVHDTGAKVREDHVKENGQNVRRWFANRLGDEPFERRGPYVDVDEAVGEALW